MGEKEGGRKWQGKRGEGRKRRGKEGREQGKREGQGERRGRRDGKKRRKGRMAEGRGEDHVAIGVISAQMYFHLLEMEPRSQPELPPLPSPHVCTLLCFKCPVVLLALPVFQSSNQWDPV